MDELTPGYRRLRRPELRELPKLLTPGEEVVAVAPGWFGGRPGLLVATTTRVFFLDKGWLYGLRFEQFEYTGLTGIDYAGGLLRARIVFVGHGARYAIEWVPPAYARDFCDRVQPLLRGGAAAPAAPRQEPAEDEGPGVEPPELLPSFADLGGAGALKQDAKRTVGLMLAFPEEAERYGVTWNGLLLHGAAGVGKTTFARALAGEFALGLVHVEATDLVSSVRGGGATKVAEVFATAARSAPCVLFFDEFDSVARRRDGDHDPEGARAVDELLTQLERARGVPGLVVVAATNDPDALDPAVVRPGRFDRRIRVDLPDEPARRAILELALRDRPTDGAVDLDDLARRTRGLTPAALRAAVDAASLAALQVSASGNGDAPLTTELLLSALHANGGSDRPTVEGWSWDSLVLPADTEAELKALQELIEDPDRAERFGVEPPSGALLVGPPGTGKTTIARVLAAQARCSFYPVSAADVTSKWAGESEQAVKQLFERARSAAPSIVFLDEVDALGAERDGREEGYERQLNQFLQEMDGLRGDRGVFVLGATNRPDRLDPALVRGGRLSRTIEIPLPDGDGRRAMLAKMTAAMPLHEVDLDALAAGTDGFSGADLHALCQQAAVHAIARGAEADAPAILAADFESALQAFRTSRETTAA